MSYLRECTILSILLCVPACAFANTTATVLGTVEDWSGVGLPDAHVTLRDSERNVHTIVTAQDGTFSLTDVPNGKCRFTIKAAGFDDLNFQGVVRGTGVLRQTFELDSAIPAGSLQGRITDNIFMSIPNATIILRSKHTEFSISTISDRNGRYQFDKLKDGAYALTIRHMAYGSLDIDIVISGNGVRERTRFAANQKSASSLAPSPLVSEDTQRVSPPPPPPPPPYRVSPPPPPPTQQGYVDIPLGAITLPDSPVFYFDGRKVEDTVLLRGNTGVTLRGNIIGNSSEGVHSLDVGSQVAAATARLHLFVWKEQAKFLTGIKPFGKSYALLIAIENYPAKTGFSRLPGSLRQVASLSQVLGRQGFEVTSFFDQDATVAKINAYLYGTLAPKLRQDDRVLFYFSGHGAHRTDALGQDVGYLVTYDYDPSTISGIPMSRIQTEYSRDLVARNVLFALDACFSGLAIPQGDPLSEAITKAQTYLELEHAIESRSRTIITAGSSDDPAINTSGGIFTRYFIRGIQGEASDKPNGMVNTTQLLEYLQTQVSFVALENGYHQVPQRAPLTSYGTGDFIFIY